MSISIEKKAYKPIEVDLWGQIFETTDPVRSVVTKITGLEKQFEEAEAEGEPDAAVELMGALLDLRLASTNGKKTKPSTLLKREWEADKVSLQRLNAFFYELFEAQSPLGD